MFELLVPVTPVPASRPRVTRFGTYYAPAYRNLIRDLDEIVPNATAPLEGELGVTVLCVCKPIGKSKHTTPMGDVDNLAKGILDTLTKKGYWLDDRQIVNLHIVKRFPKGGETPHYLVTAAQQ